MKFKYFYLVILQFFIGAGAVTGGIGLVTATSGQNLGLAAEWLEGSPFESYLIPGLVLLFVIGVGNIFAGVLTFKRKPLAGETAMILGTFLMFWIAVQVTIIPFHWLQPLYFFLGLTQVFWGTAIRNPNLMIFPEKHTDTDFSS
jgi:hypothetical protein